MPESTTHFENGRRVTDWREEQRGDRVVQVRWVYDARAGVEAWDEEVDWRTMRDY